MMGIKRAAFLVLLMSTMLALYAQPVSIMPVEVSRGTEVPGELVSALERAFRESLEASQLVITESSPGISEISMIVDSYASKPRGELTLITCLLTVSWRPYGSDAHKLPVEIKGIGRVKEEAITDAAGYFRRLLPKLLREAEGLYPPDHLALVSEGGIFIYSSEPVYRGGTEFVLLDSSREISGLLRVRSLGYWGGEAGEDDLWPHYLSADILYTDTPLQEGIGVRQLDTLGISLTLQGGLGIEGWRTGESFMNPSLMLEAVPRMWGDTASALLAAGVQGLWNSSQGFSYRRVTVQAGWVLTLLPFRDIDSHDRRIASRILVQPSAAFGWGLDIQWGHLITGRAGIRAQVLTSPQTAAGVFAETYMVFPVSSENRLLEGMGWNAGFSVTYRL